MSAMEGNLLQMLGWPLKRWRVWREISLLSALHMEISWVAPWLVALLTSEKIASAALIALLLSLMAVLVYFGLRASALLGFGQRVRQVGMVALMLLVLPKILATILYPGEALSISEVFVRFRDAMQFSKNLLPNEFLVVLALLFVWMRAIRWATADGLPSEMLGRFRWGFVILLVYVFAFVWVGQGGLGGFLYAFFFFAWMAMGSARLAHTEANPAAGSRFFSSKWFAGFGAGILAFTALLFVLDQLMRAQFPHLQQIAFYLWLVFWGLVVLALSPFIVLIAGVYEWLLRRVDPAAWKQLEPLSDFLGSARDRVAEILEELSTVVESPFLQRLLEWLNSLNLSGLLPLIRSTFLWGALLVFLLVGIYYAGRRIGIWKALRGSWRGEQSFSSEEIKQSWLAAYWRKRLGKFLGDLRNLADVRRGRRLLAAARIRRVYSYLLGLSSQLGTIRKDAETPLEFMPALMKTFPSHPEEVEKISKAYLRVRYGELDETPDDLIEVDRAWLQLRIEGERLKKERKRTLKRKKV